MSERTGAAGSPPSATPRPARRLARSEPALSEASAKVAAAAGSERAPPLLASRRPNAAPTGPADVRSGLGPYRAGLHRQIERNMLSDTATAQLGISGTATIEATISPDGRVVSARLTRSSGIRAIDNAALGAVQRGGFRAFGPHADQSDHGQRADRGRGGVDQSAKAKRQAGSMVNLASAGGGAS